MAAAGSSRARASSSCSSCLDNFHAHNQQQQQQQQQQAAAAALTFKHCGVVMGVAMRLRATSTAAGGTAAVGLGGERKEGV